jgi:hypothetical protein
MRMAAGDGCSQQEHVQGTSLVCSIVIYVLPCAQKYTIRDLTTGQLFVVDADAAAPSEASPEPGSPNATSKLVTEVSSGKEMSLEEFDRALGLHTALEVGSGDNFEPHCW